VRPIVFLLAVLFATQYTCLLPAYAATATFSAEGAQAEVPVNKIGALLLADAAAFINNSTIEVRSKTQNNNQSLLNGTVFNTEVRGAGASRHIHGMAFFQGGSSIGGLCKKGSAPERVRTSSGEILEGAISGVAADGLSVGGSRVPASNISCIDSPCAFEFDIALSGASGGASGTGEASKISFSQCNVPAATKVKVKQSSSSEGSTKARVIVSMLLVAGLATAIAVPIAVGCSHRHHHRHNNGAQQQLLLQQELLQQSRMRTGLTQTISNPFNSSSSFP
jgi:hypothetical protein